jgi:hypothetical protein
MRWEVEFTEEFEVWWNSLCEEEQEEIAAKVELLEEHGPNLGRPHPDVITTSRHSNMKELRGKVTVKGKDRFLRALFVFDPRRTALLLIGGDKTGDPKWYEKSVPIADELFGKHLKELEQQKNKSENKGRNKSESKN